MRHVQTYPENLGTPCSGALKEIEPCNVGKCEVEEKVIPPVDCELANWDEWSGCSVTCGNGVQHRRRSIARPASHGGAQCDGELAEVRGIITVGLLLSFWRRFCWWVCDFRKKIRLMRFFFAFRDHFLKSQIIIISVKGCTEKACPKVEIKVEKIDCEWGPWAEWGACSQSCTLIFYSSHLEFLAAVS